MSVETMAVPSTFSMVFTLQEKGTWRRLNEALPVAGVALAAARPEVPRQTAVAHAAALPSRELHRKLHRDPKRGTRPFFKGWVKVVKYFGYLIHENSLKLGVLRYISPQKKDWFQWRFDH
jgi:hypothetical protein